MQREPARVATGRDIVVIGASAGGVEALLEIVPRLPPDLPAAVFVVLHLHPWSPSLLPELLTGRGKLRATHAIHGEAIQPGRIYLAPPDNHLVLLPDRVEVTRGPKENNHRPSVDALFRSAARAFGPRVIGVVLSGYLDCGTAGLLSIKARNGIAIVQDPANAKAPSMPQSAVHHVEVDHVAPAAELGALVAGLTRERAGRWPDSIPSEVLGLEGEELGLPAQIVCPSCSGVMTFSSVNGFQVMRCHVGHSFSPQAVVGAQAAQLERVLWGAVRAFEETASLAQRLAAGAPERVRDRHEQDARRNLERAAALRTILLQMRDELPSAES